MHDHKRHLDAVISDQLEANFDPELDDRLQTTVYAYIHADMPEPDVKPLSSETVLQMVEGDRYLVTWPGGPTHRCAYLGTALMMGAIALVMQMPNGQVFHVTQFEGFTIENL